MKSKGIPLWSTVVRTGNRAERRAMARQHRVYRCAACMRAHRDGDPMPRPVLPFELAFEGTEPAHRACVGLTYAEAA
jgi:hypothetical protein